MSTSRPLPFQYGIRGNELARFDGQELAAATEQRDRDLEDFLAGQLVVRSGSVVVPAPFATNLYEIVFPVPFSENPVVVAWNGDITATPYLVMGQQLVSHIKFQVAIATIAGAAWTNPVRINYIAHGAL